jgi:hypothetical protein
VSAQLTWRPSMRRKRQGRQRIARLFFRKRWLFRGKHSFDLAICLRSDTIPSSRCRIRRFRLIYIQSFIWVLGSNEY